MQKLVETKASEFVKRLNNPTPEETRAITEKLATLTTVLGPYMSYMDLERQRKLDEKMKHMAEALSRSSEAGALSAQGVDASAAGQRVLPKAWQLQKPTVYTGRLIDDRVKSVTSVDALTKFLEEIGKIGPANHATTLSMAQLFYRDLGQDGVTKIVRNLLLTHQHKAQEAVWEAFITHARGEDSGARSLENYFPEPLSKESFLKWTKLGDGMTANAEFMEKLEMALGDFKDFEHVYGKSINKDKSFISVVEGFRSLDNPSLAGRFMELFLKSDRLTKQYIFDAVVELGRQNNEVTVQLKGTSSQERNASAKSIDSLLSESLGQLQELAYFEYKSNGNSARPTLPDPEITKPVALRYLLRKGLDLLDHDVEYAGKILAQYPAPDTAVDVAMTRLLASGSKMSAEIFKLQDISYALYELLALERNARKLSSLNIDLKYSASVLSKKTSYRLYLGNLLELHKKFDLRNFPALKQLTVDYFRKYPESLDDLHESQDMNVRRFKTDFGF